MRNYQCNACSGSFCITRCDKKPVYCPHYEHKDPCWVDVDQESRAQAGTDLKAGDWAWCPRAPWMQCPGDDDNDDRYFQVLEVLPDGKLRENSHRLVNPEHCQKASVRPYRGSELARMVGKVVKLYNVHQRSFMTASMVLGYNEDTARVFLYTCVSNTKDLTETAMGRWLSAEELSGLTTIDGEPCGVLQHRDLITGEPVD